MADMRVVGVQVIEAVVTMADTAAVAMTVAVVTEVVEAATTVIVTVDILEVCHRAARYDLFCVKSAVKPQPTNQPSPCCWSTHFSLVLHTECFIGHF